MEPVEPQTVRVRGCGPGFGAGGSSLTSTAECGRGLPCTYVAFAIGLLRYHGKGIFPAVMETPPQLPPGYTTLPKKNEQNGA
ncbi:Hypothetical predicted protein [Marmota monax]|uniref:Uncharacterized protein n=1 Tax=Marmota monax TaxID=9995 RepID=A0A5E4BQR0_MARMO|nr:Hypothetical predicted protein [Marmota monax]